MDLEKKEDIFTDSQKDQEVEKKSSDNIFAELSWELDFWHEKDDSPVVQKKDLVYYLKLISSILLVINIITFVFVIIWFLFVKVQNNDSLYNNSYLDPFCSILLSDEMKNTADYCSSVAALIKDYENKKSKLQKDIVDKLTLIINDTYVIENFVNSKEITFLIDNKNNRLKVLDMLNDFDNLKNDFSGGDKWMLNCYQMSITKDAVLSVSCDVNSSSWEVSDNNWKWIIWFSWDRNSSVIEWTSISAAASFLNFIEKNPKYNFQLLEKQKTFSSESIVWEWVYVKKTNIKFKLKYNNLKNSLSL